MKGCFKAIVVQERDDFWTIDTNKKLGFFSLLFKENTQDFRHISTDIFFNPYTYRQLASTWVKLDFGYDWKLFSPESNYPHFVCTTAYSLSPLWSWEAEKGPGDMRCYLYHLFLWLRGQVWCLDTLQVNMGRLLHFQGSRRPVFGSTTNLC